MDIDIIDMEIDPNRKRKRNVKVGFGVSIFLGMIGLVFKVLHWPGGDNLIVISLAMTIAWFIVKQLFYKSERGLMGGLTVTALMIGFAGIMLLKNVFYIVSETVQVFIPLFVIIYLFGRPKISKD